ncbi:MAG: hypothetical protein R3338_08030, partial [Thermoanaerobaculia bacterium]|nr:hypothetical protein [Thermoanaerobaculia bacterium]
RALRASGSTFSIRSLSAMPYNERIEAVLKELEGAREAYHAALRLAAEQVRGYLAACREGSEGLESRAGAELGEFAKNRVNAEKFATMFLTKTTPPARSVRAVERALDVLEELEGSGDDLFVVPVDSGDDLRNEVEQAMANAGRAFGAARIVDLVRTDRYEPEQHDRLLERFPFRQWNRAERRLAPPIVIDVDGADLFVSSLGDYLDGTVKLFLVVAAPAAPAPLARLITPGTFVMQTTEIEQLTPAVETVSPAIAAVLPEGAATFAHDPSAGSNVWERLTITSRPEREPKRAIGGISAAQQAEDLKLLDQLSEKATAPAAVTAGAASPTAAAPDTADTPTDRLAAWLLQQM